MRPPGDSGAATFPDVDTQALRTSANWLLQASETYFTTRLTFGSALGAATEWTGAAHDAWVRTGSQAGVDLGSTSTALSSAYQALTRLADAVDAARSQYQAAAKRRDAAQQEATSAQRNLDGLNDGPSVADPARYVAQQQACISEANAMIVRAQQDMSQAVTDVTTAAVAASLTIGQVAATAAAVGNFAGQNLAYDPDSGGLYPPDRGFLAVALGTAAVRPDGSRPGDDARWLEMIARLRLGFRATDTTFTVRVGGTIVRVTPDGLGTGAGRAVLEVKSGVQSISMTSQIRAEMQVAGDNPYILVVGQNTRVARTVVDAVANRPGGGEIVRMTEGGRFTDLNGNPIEPAGSGGTITSFRYPGRIPANGALNQAQNDPSVPVQDELPWDQAAPTDGDLPLDPLVP